MDDLGSTIAKVARNVHGGMLVFFPSYGKMEVCYSRWEKSGTLEKITDAKTVYREP